MSKRMFIEACVSKHAHITEWFISQNILDSQTIFSSACESEYIELVRNIIDTTPIKVIESAFLSTCQKAKDTAILDLLFSRIEKESTPEQIQMLLDIAFSAICTLNNVLLVQFAINRFSITPIQIEQGYFTACLSSAVLVCNCLHPYLINGYKLLTDFFNNSITVFETYDSARMLASTYPGIERHPQFIQQLIHSIIISTKDDESLDKLLEWVHDILVQPHEQDVLDKLRNEYLFVFTSTCSCYSDQTVLLNKLYAFMTTHTSYLISHTAILEAIYSVNHIRILEWLLQHIPETEDYSVQDIYHLFTTAIEEQLYELAFELAEKMPSNYSILDEGFIYSELFYKGHTELYMYLNRLTANDDPHNFVDLFEMACASGMLEFAQQIYNDHSQVIRDTLTPSNFRTDIYSTHNIPVVEWLLQLFPLTENVETDVNNPLQNNYLVEQICRRGEFELLEFLYQRALLPVNGFTDSIAEKVFIYACYHGKLDIAKWVLQIKPTLDVLKQNDEAYMNSRKLGNKFVSNWILKQHTHASLTK